MGCTGRAGSPTGCCSCCGADRSDDFPLNADRPNRERVASGLVLDAEESRPGGGGKLTIPFRGVIGLMLDLKFGRFGSNVLSGVTSVIALIGLP